MSEVPMLIDRYNRLQEITRKVIEELTPGGVEILPLLTLVSSRVRFGLDEVAALISGTESPHDREHLIQVHLAGLESHMYRHGHLPTGHMVRIFSGNYSVATEEAKRSIIADGYRYVTAIVASEEDLIAATPLRRVKDAEFSDVYERLYAAWGCSDQKEASRKMKSRLSSIHDLLSRHKIGDDFIRERRGKQVPLPLYVPNEIHHPTNAALPGTEAFERDKRIGYAIMDAWLSEDGANDPE